MTARSYDILVLGATGFTGKCAVKFLATLTKEKYWDVTWAVSGRSKEKIQNLITELNKSGLAIKNIPVVETDVQKEESLRNALQTARVVINCTGPNVTLSPRIVKACIETKTHYLDISAEIFHILHLYRSYHKESEDANVLVLPSCGYSTIPAEAGMIYLERQFKGTLDTVECYTQILIPKRAYIPGIAGAVLHNGTWTSVVHALATYKEHMALKKELFPEPVELEPAEMKKSFFHRNEGQTWFPHPGIENDTVEMAQRYLHEKSNKKYVHFKIYTTVQICFHFLMVPMMFLYYYLSYFNGFRWLLINYPRLFTFGYVSEKGPSERMRKDTRYQFLLNGKGWGMDDDLKSAPTKSLSVKVTGCDPGYDSAVISIVMCAITVLKESSNMPRGGVILPGAAFFRTDLVDRLMHDGLSFEVIRSGKDPKETRYKPLQIPV